MQYSGQAGLPVTIAGSCRSCCITAVNVAILFLKHLALCIGEKAWVEVGFQRPLRRLGSVANAARRPERCWS